MHRLPRVLAVAATAVFSGGQVTAQSKLSEVGYVTEGLIAVALAYEISEVCDDIGARTLRGIAYLNQLRTHARELGFSNDEIKAFTDDKGEQNRLEAIARQRLEAKGAIPGDEASHCAVGRAEIAAGTTIGYLLR